MFFVTNLEVAELTKFFIYLCLLAILTLFLQPNREPIGGQVKSHTFAELTKSNIHNDFDLFLTLFFDDNRETNREEIKILDELLPLKPLSALAFLLLSPINF